MKMKFYNLVLLTTAFVALLFLYYVKKSFDWLIGLEEEVIPIDPPEIAIVKEMQMIKHGNYEGSVSYPDIPVMIWWALFHEESPKNNPIFSHPEVMTHFNHTSTFRQQSHFPLTTQYLESIEYITGTKLLVPLEVKNSLQKEKGLAPVAYVQSGCDTPSMRDSWVMEFMKHIKVDSYGTCLNNKHLPSDIAGSEQFENEKF